MSVQVEYFEAWMRLMRSWGFTVHEAAGWRTRDAEPRSTFLPGMLHMEHHDASSRLSGNWGALNYIINKKLSNIVTARDGQITLCAAGVTWHAGVGSRDSLGNIPRNGANPRSMSNEVANSGSEPYDPRCTRAIIAAERAWAIVSGREGQWERIIGHKEWADPPGRKTDPSIDMNQRRRDVAAFQPGPPPAPAPRKSNQEIAAEVIAGHWGVGAERVRRLTEAGYDARAVQAEVNRLLAPPPPPPPPPPVVEEHEYADPELGSKLRVPVQAGTYRITSGFGLRNGSEHRGVDFAHSTPGQDYSGAPLFAMEDGEVIEGRERENVRGFGGWAWIRHVIDGQPVDTILGHMYQRDILVKKGDRVKRGQLIAKVGNNGDSTGAHAHAEVWVGGDAPRVTGQAVNPMPYWEKAVEPSLPIPEPDPAPSPPEPVEEPEKEPETAPEPVEEPEPKRRTFQELLSYVWDLLRNRR